MPIIFFSLIALCISFIIFFLIDVIAPFIAAICITYALHPLVDQFSKYRFIKHRWISSMCATSFFFGFIVLILAVLGPMIYYQLYHIILQISNNRNLISQAFIETLSKLDSFSPHIRITIQEQISTLSNQLTDAMIMILKGLVQSGFFAANAISFFIITPFTTFYLLKDSESVKNALFSVIPFKYKKQAKKLFTAMQSVITGFFRGQLLVCLVLSVYYIIAFFCIGLESWFSLGLLSGILIFIPYLGAFTATILTALIAISQFGIDFHLVVLSFLLALGQLLEGIILAPKLVGTNVKLHPIWVIFSLIAGWHIAGFGGVLISVPFGAILGVIIRFCLLKYRNSEFYKNR